MFFNVTSNHRSRVEDTDINIKHSLCVGSVIHLGFKLGIRFGRTIGVNTTYCTNTVTTFGLRAHLHSSVTI